MSGMLAFGVHFFGVHLNWWETVLVLLFAPAWLTVLGMMWDD